MTLSLRQRQVLAGVAAGQRIWEIARELEIAAATVKVHLMFARRAMSASTSAEAAAKAIRAGLL